MSLGSGAGKVQETPAQKTAAQTALDYYAEYKRVYRPAQNKFIARTTQNYSADKTKALGAASNATDAAFGGADGKVVQALSGRGAGPGSGASTLAMADVAGDQAASRGLNLTSTRQAVEDKHQSDLATISQIGKGQAAQASQGFNTLAGLSERQAENDAQISANNAAGRAQLIGTLAGAGLRYASAPAAPQTNDFAAVTPPDAQGLTRTGGGMLYNFPTG